MPPENFSIRREEPMTLVVGCAVSSGPELGAEVASDRGVADVVFAGAAHGEADEHYGTDHEGKLGLHRSSLFPTVLSVRLFPGVYLAARPTGPSPRLERPSHHTPETYYDGFSVRF